MKLKENGGNSMSMFCFPLMQGKHSFLAEMACLKMVFLSFEGQMIFAVWNDSYFTTIQEKTCVTLAKQRFI